MDFEQALKEVIWRLVTEGGISYRRIKLSFGLDDDALEELRRELIGIKRLAADVDGERLIWAPDGRTAQPERFKSLLLMNFLGSRSRQALGGREITSGSRA